MRRPGLRHRVEELVAAASTQEREMPAAPEVVALAALLVAHVQHPDVRRRVADSLSVDDLLRWIAVDRLAVMLPDGFNLPSGPRRSGPRESLIAAAAAVARLHGK